MTLCWQGLRSPEPTPIQQNMTLLGFTVMPVAAFKQDQYTVIVVTDGTLDGFGEAVRHIDGDYDWWYGEIAPGIYAYSIVTEDASGYVGNPDWSELPELFKSDILAGLRRTLPS